MFMAKKIISAFLMPVPGILLCLGAGLFFLWFTRRQTLGKFMVTLGAAGFFLAGFSPFTTSLILPFERAYPAYVPGPESVEYILVLGGASTDDPALPTPSKLYPPSLYRVTEGIRIHRLTPGSTLIFSGFSMGEETSNAQVAAATAKALGVAPESIIMEPRPRDTREEALFVKEIVGTAPFILVTSASHMVRAMALFQKEGLSPIPAPAGHNIRQGKHHSLFRFMPGPASIHNFHRVIYESLGIAWARLRYGA